MKITVRMITQSDERPLRRLVMHYLRETYPQGGDFLPTLENAASFVAYAIQGAAEGDPCLVAESDEHALIGFVMLRGVPFPGMQTRDVTARSWGSYVVPEHRGKGHGSTLWLVGANLASRRGYTRLLGMTHGTAYEENALRAIKALVDMQEVGKVLSMDLRNMACTAKLRRDVPDAATGELHE